MHRVALRNSVRAAALAASKVRTPVLPIFPSFCMLNGVLQLERCPQYPCCVSLICDSKGRYVFTTPPQSLPRLMKSLSLPTPDAL